MVRSKKEVETIINLINISYCTMKFLPYKDETFSQYKGINIQEIRLALNHKIIFATFVKNVKTKIKSNAFANTLKLVLLSFGYHK